MSARPATHAGSWYSSSKATLSQELDDYLAAVPDKLPSGETLPIDGGRIIVAPHAGYSYSGPTAAWAYKAWDLSKAKRIFLLGPSHHFYLNGAALTSHTSYSTPLGPLIVDRETTASLKATGHFGTMSASTDANEHSLELHLPYIYKMLSRAFPSAKELPPLIPIMIGATSPSTEKTLGRLLAPYVEDSSNAFVISSDFCHWGSRFGYTYYLPLEGQAIDLSGSIKPSPDRAIHESIAELDRQAMDAIEKGSHAEFTSNLKETGNTVCGRHPIGVLLAATEHLAKEQERQSKWKFVHYARSSDCVKVKDSSVSYASAYAVV
ncbi:MAG: hypothetical protein M1814_002500 [Vezdaea aestivalis]|nr:MAG: hypothetical protein M1814_002500 [Vezdaea aestivalis]